jgi:hypothetical protein
MSLHVWPGEKECLRKTSIYYGPLLLAFDPRFNPHLYSKNWTDVLPPDPWKPSTTRLEIRELEAARMSPIFVECADWLAPHLLLEFTAKNGQKVNLCAFGSAGESGTSYASWLPMTNTPQPIGFSSKNPLPYIH